MTDIFEYYYGGKLLNVYSEENAKMIPEQGHTMVRSLEDVNEEYGVISVEHLPATDNPNVVVHRMQVVKTRDIPEVTA
jgi:hypothetical protein